MHEDVGKRFKLKVSDKISEFLHNSTGEILEVVERTTWRRDCKVAYTVMLDIPKSNHISTLSKMHIEREHFDFYDGEEII